MRARYLLALSAILTAIPIDLPSCQGGTDFPSAGWIYFADNSARTVNRMRFDGSGLEVLATTERALLGLTIDTESRKLYWSDNPRDGFAALHRANLDGSDAEVFYRALLPDQDETIGQLAMDQLTRTIYWTDSGSDRIRGMKLDGTGPFNVVENDNTLDDALEIDPDNQVLYFSTRRLGTETIERINLDGTGRETISNSGAYSLFVDNANERLLGADWHEAIIFDLDLNSLVRNDLFVARSRDVQRFRESLFYTDLEHVRVDSTFQTLVRIMKSDLEGNSAQVLFEVNRRETSTDPIAFFLLVPEPSSMILSAVVFLLLAIHRFRVRWNA